MGYQETKAFINANIKPNGENEITGSILNTALNDVLDSGHEEVNQLGQEVYGLHFGISAFGTDASVPYYMADGTVKTNNGRLRTDKIRVEPGTIVNWKLCNTSSVIMIAAFNSLGEIVVANSLVGTDPGSSVLPSGTYTVPNGIAYLSFCSNDSGRFQDTDIEILYPNRCELWKNKVTSVSASSTDEQYPSAKCVYDGLETKLPNSAIEIGIVSNNIANPDNIISGKLINNNGVITTNADWTMIAVPVSAGQVITFGGFNLKRSGYRAFYNGETKITEESYSFDNPGNYSPVTVIVPSNATVLYIDIKSDETGSNYDNLMINYGDTWLPKDTYREAVVAISGHEVAGVNTQQDIPDLIADLPVSDGTTIASGYAYIDSTDRTVKVKE